MRAGAAADLVHEGQQQRRGDEDEMDAASTSSLSVVVSFMKARNRWMAEIMTMERETLTLTLPLSRWAEYRCLPEFSPLCASMM